jgi:hypothetical protein
MGWPFGEKKKQLCRDGHQEKNPQNLKPREPTELLI